MQRVLAFALVHLPPSPPPSLPASTDGLTTPTESALIPQPVGSAPRLGSMSTNSRIMVEWNPAPPLSFSSPIVYRLEYSLMHMNGSRVPTQVAIVSNLVMVISSICRPSRSAVLLSDTSSHNVVPMSETFILRHLSPVMVKV